MFEPIDRDRLLVPFAGTRAGRPVLTWGQKVIFQDMRESSLMTRHAGLRMRMRAGDARREVQEIAGSGRTGLEILTFPDDADRADVDQHAVDLMDSWSATRLDFERDWPLRTAALRYRGAPARMWSGCCPTWPRTAAGRPAPS